MRALKWGIKGSLITYVRGLPDGVVDVLDGASETDGAFFFPAAEDASGEFSFTGNVYLRGHGGMMDLPVANPRVERAGDAWSLTIQDPDEADERLVFATIAQFEADAEGHARATGTALSADGAGLFFGPYREGTEVDDPEVISQPADS